MNYLFTLGRNIELSKAEILAYLEKEQIPVASFSQSSNGFLVECEKEINMKKAITSLGGTLSIGNVLTKGSLNQIIEYLHNNEIYFSSENKFTYSLFTFSVGSESDELKDKLKQKFRQEKLKAQFRELRGNIRLQNGKVLKGTPGKITDVSYFLFKDKEYFFGEIKENYDSKENEKRDMGKPARRESLAISPRLARILINLSQARENSTLLDPFCGIGVILQEALLQNIKVLGVDRDEEAVKDAARNLDWLKSNYNVHADYKLINADSRNINNKNFDSIATEPSLGKLLKKKPNDKEAKSILLNFEEEVIPVLKKLKELKKPEARIAITFPFIRSFSVNIDKICSRTGLQVKVKGIKEFRPDQFVSREVYVLV